MLDLLPESARAEIQAINEAANRTRSPLGPDGASLALISHIPTAQWATGTPIPALLAAADKGARYDARRMRYTIRCGPIVEVYREDPECAIPDEPYVVIVVKHLATPTRSTGESPR